MPAATNPEREHLEIPFWRTRLAMGQDFLCRLAPLELRCIGSIRLYPRAGVEAGNEAVPRSFPVEGLELGAGMTHACVLSMEAKLLCFGSNRYDELGSGEPPRMDLKPIPDLTPVRSFGVGHGQTCVVLEAGLVTCFGSMQAGVGRLRHVVPDLEGVSHVAAGFFHVCALKLDGSVWCWGPPDFGPAGEDLQSDRPSRISLPVRVVAIAAGSHSCALDSDGFVWCWGNNANQQLGTREPSARAEPEKVPGVETAVQISAGPYHTCARLRDGTVRCWGCSLANDSTETCPAREVPGVTGAVDIVAGYYSEGPSCAELASGAIVCWEDSPAPQARKLREF